MSTPKTRKVTTKQPNRRHAADFRLALPQEHLGRLRRRRRRRPPPQHRRAARRRPVARRARRRPGAAPRLAPARRLAARQRRRSPPVADRRAAGARADALRSGRAARSPSSPPSCAPSPRATRRPTRRSSSTSPKFSRSVATRCRDSAKRLCARPTSRAPTATPLSQRPKSASRRRCCACRRGCCRGVVVVVDVRLQLRSDDDNDSKLFICLARVLSGTLRPGMRVRVLGPKHNDLRADGVAGGDDGATTAAPVAEIGALYVMMGQNHRGAERGARRRRRRHRRPEQPRAQDGAADQRGPPLPAAGVAHRPHGRHAARGDRADARAGLPGADARPRAARERRRRRRRRGAADRRNRALVRRRAAPEPLLCPTCATATPRASRSRRARRSCRCARQC
jgi:hypothetical protein